MEDNEKVEVQELVVLSKFDGEALPENEVERLTVKDGFVLAHEVIENEQVVGPVENSDIVGKDIGRLITQEQEVE